MKHRAAGRAVSEPLLPEDNEYERCSGFNNLRIRKSLQPSSIYKYIFEYQYISIFRPFVCRCVCVFMIYDTEELRGTVQGDYVGFNTGSVEKLSYSQAGQASCLHACTNYWISSSQPKLLS